MGTDLEKQSNSLKSANRDLEIKSKKYLKEVHEKYRFTELDRKSLQNKLQ